jgi:hypothetical protein
MCANTLTNNLLFYGIQTDSRINFVNKEGLKNSDVHRVKYYAIIL